MTLNLQMQIERYLHAPHRFAYDGEWKFADLLTMTAGKLAVKFVVDRYGGTDDYRTMTC